MGLLCIYIAIHAVKNIFSNGVVRFESIESLQTKLRELRGERYEEIGKICNHLHAVYLPNKIAHYHNLDPAQFMKISLKTCDVPPFLTIA